MTAATLTLTDFLLARITEDEADIQRIGYDRRVAEMSGQFAVDHPLRLLAECEAKRRIVELHYDGNGGLYDTPQKWCAECHHDGDDYEWPCATVRILAAVYADHPDYEESRRP